MLFHSICCSTDYASCITHQNGLGRVRPWPSSPLNWPGSPLAEFALGRVRPRPSSPKHWSSSPLTALYPPPRWAQRGHRLSSLPRGPKEVIGCRRCSFGSSSGSCSFGSRNHADAPKNLHLGFPHQRFKVPRFV